MTRDLDTPPPQHVKLNGPAGTLAGTYELPAGNVRATVLHLHPHPLHGGTRRNNVVRYGALGSLQANCAALRIDFRGVAGSEGVHDEGRGEVDDAYAAYAWLGEQFPEAPQFVWGFSFGSRVGLDLAIRLRNQAESEARFAGYLAVAWPTAIYPWPRALNWPKRMKFLAGDRDRFVDLDQMKPATERGGELKVIPGAEHFFKDCLDEVRGFTADGLQAWL